MDIRDLTLKAEQYDNDAVMHLARVSASASALANRIHAGDSVGVTLTMVSQHLEEAVTKVSKAQALYDLHAEQTAQPKTDPSHRSVVDTTGYAPMSDTDLRTTIDEIIYSEFGYETDLTRKIMDVIKDKRGR